ncbi:hypothetical protein [Pseudobacteroides cellulosolvens]|nr:hypothetical protein [Pseudobacteroides cellulosolvens]
MVGFEVAFEVAFKIISSEFKYQYVRIVTGNSYIKSLQILLYEEEQK